MAVLSRPADFSGRFIKADGRSGKPQWPFYQQWPIYQGEAKRGGIRSGPPFGGRFRVILFGASLTLARHDSGSMRAPASPAGAMRVALPRSPRVRSAPAASEAARRNARRPLTVVRASLGLGFRV